MPDISENVLKEIQKEVKGFGGDMKSLSESVNKDLDALRKLAAAANDAAPETKAQIDALATLVTEKTATFDTALAESKARADKLETAMNRRQTETTEADGPDDDARAFYEAKAAALGSLNWRSAGDEISKESVEGYDLWRKSFGTYLRASDERSIEAKALSVGSNPDGGYLIPTAVSSRIIKKIFESSPIRQLATVETIGTSDLDIPIDTGEASGGWVGETQAPTDSTTPQIGIQKIPVHEYAAMPKATQKLIEDAAVNMEAWIANKTADKFARAEAAAFISGTGVNMPRGILTYSAGSAGARGTINQYASGHATLLTADAINQLPLQIKSSYLGGAVWLMKRSTVAAVLLMKNGQDDYMWRQNMVDGQPSLLNGYRVIMADDMPAVAAGSLSVAFGDFRDAYTVVDRIGITTLRDPYSAKPFIQFYSRKRVGGDVVDFEALTLLVTSA